MYIIPAIDLLGGKVVRLFQGDYEKRRVFGEDPAAFAKLFYDSGARWLHVVDLDGARAGSLQNLDSVGRIIEAVPGMQVELGGGIRDEDAFIRCLETGVSRVILGTAALRDRPFVERMAKEHEDALAVGVDARNSLVAVEGWLSDTDTDSVAFCKEMLYIGVKHIIYTDISKDGAGAGANLSVYRRLTGEIKGVCFTAAGGVSSLDEIAELKKMGMYAAILGSALYTGVVNLAEAIKNSE